jgi:FixJ family two-component response regulator
MEGTAVTEQVQIAVVDDDESFRIALEGFIRSLGYLARSFSSGDEFMGSTDLRHYACIISDIQMPGMSGIEMKQRLALNGIAIPVIMVTARMEPFLRDQALQAGALCVIRKPFDPQDLIACIDGALGN